MNLSKHLYSIMTIVGLALAFLFSVLYIFYLYYGLWQEMEILAPLGITAFVSFITYLGLDIFLLILYLKKGEKNLYNLGSFCLVLVAQILSFPSIYALFDSIPFATWIFLGCIYVLLFGLKVFFRIKTKKGNLLN
ncbi:MAG: hypothetical protein K2I88_03060 [Anaeroplasmataceae bacterium]|nr:hypothetical protein [Anaeroplasmataceae bacterium]